MTVSTGGLDIALFHLNFTVIRLIATTSELSEARAELVRLEKQEQQLVEQLHYAPTSIREQRKKIDEPLRQTSPLIERLLDEILLRIFELCIRHPFVLTSPGDSRLHRMKELADVSRHWMHIVKRSSSLWTMIKMSSSWSTSAAKLHVAKSCQRPLEIEVSGWVVAKVTTRECLGC